MISTVVMFKQWIEKIWIVIVLEKLLCRSRSLWRRAWQDCFTTQHQTCKTKTFAYLLLGESNSTWVWLSLFTNKCLTVCEFFFNFCDFFRLRLCDVFITPSFLNSDYILIYNLALWIISCCCWFLLMTRTRRVPSQV